MSFLYFKRQARITISSDVSFNNCTLSAIDTIQVEKGSEKTSYEEFTPPVFALKDECFKEPPITRQELRDTIDEKTANLGIKEKSIKPIHTTFYKEINLILIKGFIFYHFF